MFEEIKKEIVYKDTYNINCTNCEGDYLIDSKNVDQVIAAMRMQDCKYYACGDAAVNCMDIFMS